MKSIQTLRTFLFVAILALAVCLIHPALAQVSPRPKKASPTPKKVSPTPAKVSPTPAKVSPAPAKASPAPAAKYSSPVCNRTIKVQVVALDQPWMWNRLGAAQPGGMIYALARDVVKSADNKPLDDLETLNKQGGLKPLCGGVRLRDDKRARPLVLRANKGDCLEITFVNLLSEQPVAKLRSPPPKPPPPTPTRWAGLSSTGMELVGSIDSDASWVGTNANNLAKNGDLKVYKWHATEEGTFLLYSSADTESGYQANQGLFGAIHVEPEGAEWYRSQITHDDLVQATLSTGDLQFSQEIVDLQVPGPSKPDPSNPDPTKKDASQSAASQKTAEQLRLPPGFRLKAMENRIADKVSSLPVFVNEETKDAKGNPVDPRIYSATGQPLINYYAVYRDGKPRQPSGRPLPVLQMLQVTPIGKPLYDQPLKKDNPDAYRDDLRALDAGIIPTDLRKIFKDSIKVELSAGARVTDQYRYSWLITDQGRAFYMEGIPPVKGNPGKPGELKISNAQLELIYSDLTAIITGPNAGRFALSNTSPTFRAVPASPDRRQPYREYTIIYHQGQYTAQAFAAFYNANLQNTFFAGADQFAINYGSGAIAPEVIANRLGVGPMGNKDAVDLKFEEFFLSAWAVGDPAMVVDLPANASTVKEDSNAMVAAPGEHPALRTQVPKGSAYAQIVAPSPRPPQFIPPASDDYAPLPKPPVKATKAFFPDDPSNVYHSYMNDHVKFRIHHAGAGPSHVHHLHAHQWLRSPDSDSSSYLDSQLIVPGSSFTLEIAYNGSGNRNKTVGDSIFHCHFYPHFAQGMWALWRVHDVFEQGTLLDADGRPKKGINRALPDGEIELGTPIPAVVPLPTLGMAPMPAQVRLTDLSPWKPKGEGQGRRVEVIQDTGPDGKKFYANPGFPFFIPGVSGHRPPHPPLDFAWLENPETRMPILDDKNEKILLDGGLPRHMVLDGKVLKEFHTRWDFTKDTALRDKDGKIVPGAGVLEAFALPEAGTPVEVAAMADHAIRTRPTVQPNGEPANFILNGLPPTHGAPYADPAVNAAGDANVHRRRYQAAVFQLDTILNKKGWHYPQQRMISLWQDVKPTLDKTRPPEPLFFRTNTSDTIQFWHTNLLPAYYELDDFQVRTPTDIVGQHIHLVKFDVTASDGAGNGFNYEDGTFAPDEVQERIDSINGKDPSKRGLFAFDPATGFVNPDPALRTQLTLKKVADYYPPPGSTFVELKQGVPVWQPSAATAGSVFGPPGGHDDAWDGAQTTIQLWEVDSLLNNEGVDRTLRTVFSHDHFGPSTHQQAGLYAGMIVEPENSAWYLPYGERMNTRADGGPTSWHGFIVTEDPKDSYREFVLEFQDMQLAYQKGSRKEPSAESFKPLPYSNQTPPPNATPTPAPAAAFELSQAHSLKAIQDVNPSIAKFYVDQLNKAQLPTGGQPVPNNQLTVPGFQALFVEFGIPLSDKATVAVNTKDVDWTITEAADQVNAGAQYVVRAGKDSTLLVYTPGIHPSWSDPNFALNAPKDGANADNGPPFAQLVSQNEFGTYSMNYRNEPVPFRVSPVGVSPSPSPGPSPDQVDLALAYSSSIQRVDGELNIQPDGKTAGYPKTALVPNAQPTDPYTPLLEAYVNDRVQIRTLVGAHTQAHALQVHGVKWRFEPDNLNSGWRNAQLMGLSEHFEMIFDLPGTTAPHAPPLKDTPQFADYFYSPSSDIVGLNNGLWGIMRAYGSILPKDPKDPRNWLEPLPNNPAPAGSGETDLFKQGYTDAKNAGQPTREYEVTAVTARVLLPEGRLVFKGPAWTNAAVLYVHTKDLDVIDNKTAVLRKGVPVEPLILRAAAGEWIKVTLHNGFALNDPGLLKVPPVPSDPAFTTTQTLSKGTPFNGSTLPPVEMWGSTYVGLHPQLVAYDPIKANGLLVGFNPKDGPTGTLVAPGNKGEFYWYAGELKREADGTMKAIPIEFGATNLTSADPLLQPQFGMVGALIIEPEGSTWVEDVDPKTKTKTYASATVNVPGGYDFREFVIIDQNLVANSTQGVGAINYRSEPLIWPPRDPQVELPQPPPQGYSQAFSNTMYASPADPLTPVFTAAAGTPVRFRLLIPSTVTSNSIIAPPVLMIHGHPWQEEPYTADSTKIGFNPLSEWQGAVQGGVGQKFDLVLPSAGGQNRIAGDYLYNTYQTANTTGTWGLFRVTNSTVAIEKAVLEGGFAEASGVVKAVTSGASLPKQVRVFLASDAGGEIDLGTASVAADGQWTLRVASELSAPARMQVTAIEENGRAGATATVTITASPPAEKLVTQRD